MTSRTSAAAGEYLHGVADYLERVQIYPYFHLLVKELVAQQPADPVQFLIDFIPKNPTTARIVVLGPGCESFAKCIAADGVGVAKADEIEVCDGAVHVCPTREHCFQLASEATLRMFRNYIHSRQSSHALKNQALGSKDAIIASLRAKPKWVCYGYPRNAEDALDIASARVLVSLVVVLQDSMQTEGSSSPNAKWIFTLQFAPPSSQPQFMNADETRTSHGS